MVLLNVASPLLLSDHDSDVEVSNHKTTFGILMICEPLVMDLAEFNFESITISIALETPAIKIPTINTTIDISIKLKAFLGIFLYFYEEANAVTPLAVALFGTPYLSNKYFSTFCLIESSINSPTTMIS